MIGCNTKDHVFPTGRGRRVLRFDTAWGQGELVYTPEPFAVYCITLPGIRPDLPPISAVGQKAHHPSALAVKAALAAFFAGHKPEAIPKSWLSLDQLTPKEQAVLDVVSRIPYGATQSYGEVAEKAGFPQGGRFAGNALNKNPFPVIIPCHRVIRADGTIGGFGSGCEMKRRMIALEATTSQKDSRIQGQHKKKALTNL